MLTLTSRPYLFVDDQFIDTADSVRIELHHPVRQNVAFSFDAPWEGPSSTYCTVLDIAAGNDSGTCPFEQPRYRLFYRGMAGDTDLVGECTCVAESEDGIAFRRRNTWKFPACGSTANNIIWAGQNDISHNFAPFVDTNPSCTPEVRFKAIGGVSRHKVFALASPDGLDWHLFHDDPVLTEGDFDSLNVAFWDAANGWYAAYVRKSHGGFRSIDRCISEDFIHWSKPEPLDLGPGELEHLYTNAIRPYARNASLYLGFPMRFFPHRTRFDSLAEKGVSDAVLIASRDGLHFPRHFREAFVRPGLDQRNWTQRNLITAAGMIQTSPSELSIYWVEHYDHHDCNLMRGTLRVDGFTSLHGGVPGGSAVSRPLKLEGTTLQANLSTSAGGSVKIGLCDETGKPLDGFSIEDCDDLFGDDLARTVRWNGSPDLSRLKGDTVRLHLMLRDADVYSLSAVDR